MTAFTKSHTTSLFASLAVGVLCVSFAGCGGEKAGDAQQVDQVVTPPPMQTAVAEPSDVGSNQPPKEAPGTMELPPAAETDSTPTRSPPGGIEMPSGDDTSAKILYASWQEIEQMAKSSGKVTIVDIWATSCPPCIKELPGLVEIHKTMGDKVQCIALDIDYYGSKRKPPEFFLEDVTKVIESVGVNFPSYICNTSSDDVYEQADVVSIPAVLVYDAGGKLVKKYVDEGFTYHKDVIPFVSDLLK